MSDIGFEVQVKDGIPVTLPSGSSFPVATDSEQRYVEERARRYMTDNHFTNVSDLQDVDRMLMFELFIHRWSMWMSKGMDYFNEPVDEQKISRQINEYSTELRQVKKNLGIDKVTRDRQRGDDSISTYLENLKIRAKSFGVTRNLQATKSVELFQQLKAQIIFHDNADEIERVENAVTIDDIIEWLRSTAIPEFDKIDDEFRKSEQTMWIRQM